MKFSTDFTTQLHEAGRSFGRVFNNDSTREGGMDASARTSMLLLAAGFVVVNTHPGAEDPAASACSYPPSCDAPGFMLAKCVARLPKAVLYVSKPGSAASDGIGLVCEQISRAFALKDSARNRGGSKISSVCTEVYCSPCGGLFCSSR
jgi:hypothetical protein